ncbi:MAG: 6-carboxytetrahydropterin synthase [Coriobacteriales bacterium]|nr:6-carboxytetrahydropterin synthase [Coriobacteriales bacterium]
MYYVSKRLEISGAHAVDSCVEGYCEALHGHNWIITVHCKSKELNEDGMVIDFTRIKKLIHGTLDHTNLNETLPYNPTAENIARWCAEQIGETCYKVEVAETETNIAVWERDE